MLKPGDKAPDFTLLDQDGEAFSLSGSLQASKALHLLYFYPMSLHAGRACPTSGQSGQWSR
jgi:peroxiredoxin